MALVETLEQGPTRERAGRRWHVPARWGSIAVASAVVAVAAVALAGAHQPSVRAPRLGPGIVQPGLRTGVAAAADTVTLSFQLALAQPQPQPLQVRGLGPVRGAHVDWALAAPVGASVFGEQWHRLVGTVVTAQRPIQVRLQLTVSDCASLGAADGMIPLRYADQNDRVRSTELAAPTGASTAAGPTAWNHLAVVQGCGRGWAERHGPGRPMADLPELGPGAPRAPRAARG